MAATVIATNFLESGAWDVVPFFAGACALVYAKSATELVVALVTASGIFSSTTIAATNIGGAATVVPIQKADGSWRHNVLWADNGALKHTILDDALGVVLATRTIAASAVGCRNITGSREPGYDDKDPDGRAWRVWFERTGIYTVPDTNDVVSVVYRCDGVALSSSNTLWGTSLMSHAFAHGDYSHVWGAVTSGGESTAVLLSFIEGPDVLYSGGSQFKHVVAHALVGRSVGQTLVASSIPAVLNLGSGKYRTVMLYNDRLLSDGVVSKSIAIVDVQLDIAHDQVASTPAGDATGAANPQLLCGRPSNIGFPHRPATITPNTPSATGGAITNGTRSYVAVYEWSDESGRIYRSAPSNPVQVVFAGGTSTQSLVVPIPTLRSSNHEMPLGTFNLLQKVRMHLYRTVADGTTYYKVSNTGVENDAYADTVNHSDTVSDAAIADNELLYTTGGLLDWIGCPPARSVTTNRRRLIVASADNPKMVYASGEFSPGEGVWFNEVLSTELTDDVVALASLDGRTVVFHADAIGALVGDWGNRSGYGQTIDYQEISVAIGCSNARSVLTTPAGVIFQASSGIYILDRSLQVQHVGDPVYDHERTTITRAVLHSVKPIALLFLADGNVLVWDYARNVWGIWTSHAAVDAVVWRDKLCWAKSDGTVCIESTGFVDDTTPYAMRIGTGWYALGGPVGVERVYWVHLLGEYRSPHTLTVDVYYDYDDSAPAETHQLTVSAAATPEQMRFRPSRDRCQAVRFEIYDTPTGGTYESWSATGVALDVGINRKVVKLGEAKTA